MDRVIVTAVGIVLAVGLSALVFIGANKLFDLAESNFPYFNTGVGAISGLAIFGVLWGNRLVANGLIITIIGAVLGAATGYALGISKDPNRRLLVGLAGGLTMGLLLGFTVRSPYWPGVDWVAAVVGLVIGAALGFGVWALTGRDLLIPKLSLGLALGWTLGAWGAADYTVTLADDGTITGSGGGTQVEAIIVAAVLGLLVGAFVGSVPFPDKLKRADISLQSRKYIFLAPALLFVVATLVIPLVRTIWLGFLTGNPNDLTWTGLSNYGDIFTDPGIIDFSNADSMFSSRLFWIAIVLLVAGVALGRWLGRSGGTGLGTGFALGAGPLTLLAGGVVLIGFAIFVAIRGTIPNNLWWIFSVIIFSVGLGLAVAVLADRSKGENLAKSLIFLPMAISFVGASVIWRLMYVARPPTQEQTGVFNTLWVQIGRWSNSETASTVIVVILALIIAGILYLAWRGWQSDSPAIAGGSLVLTLPSSG